MMSKNFSSRNKTIRTTVSEGAVYLNKCLKENNLDTCENLDITQLIDKTICGDSLDVMKKLPSKFVDLLIADPPYNLRKNYHGNKFAKVSDNEYAEYTRNWLEKALPLLKPSASLYICCDWASSLVIGNVLKEYSQKDATDISSLIIQNRITWQREKGRGAKKNWKNSMEDIWFCTKTDKYTFNLEAVKIRRKVVAPYRKDGKPKDWKETEYGNYRDTCPGNFWDDISIPYWSMAENTEHPTQKPEKLVAKLILASSCKNDIVFDPFLGSGTTSVTAKKLNRHYIGIEQNEQYCVWAEQRLATAETEKTIQGFKDEVFWERNSGK